jgi:hypothetical protein
MLTASQCIAVRSLQNKRTTHKVLLKAQIEYFCLFNVDLHFQNAYGDFLVVLMYFAIHANIDSKELLIDTRFDVRLPTQFMPRK